MKGIIRKTGEKITIVSYRGSSERREPLTDNVSYIDSNGVEHHHEQMNLFWDVEVINEQQELQRAQVMSAKTVTDGMDTYINTLFTKREMVAMKVFTSIVNGIYAHGHSKYWNPEEIAKETSVFTDCFMKTFIKDKQP